MEAKLEMLRRTVDTAEPAKSGPGGDSGRWRGGSAAKPLTKGYVKGVLDTKPRARSGSQQRASPNGLSAAEETAREAGGAGGGSGRATPTQPAPQGRVGELTMAQSGASAAAASSSSRAAVNLQAHMQQQSNDGLEVEAFLASLKLDRYVSLFMEQGFDCMDVVQEMQESHMKDIGMAPGHILKLRKKIAELAPPSAAPPPPAPHPPAQDLDTTRPAAVRQVSFGRTEEVPLKSGASAGTGGGSNLLDGGFNEDESAASFQEALRAWREGRGTSGPTAAGTSAGNTGPASSPKATPGAFWSSLGDCEMDLVRCSTPLKPPAEPSAGSAQAETEAQQGPSGGEEKLCCYQCYKQFFAKYAVERECALPDTGGNKVKKLCSEACAERWAAAAEAKAEANRKRQEQLEKMQEMQRAVQADQHLGSEDPGTDLGPQNLLPPEAPVAQAVA